MRAKALALAALSMPAVAVARRKGDVSPRIGQDHQPLGMRPQTWRSRINSHREFVHDSIDSLGYDWARIGHPGIAPKYPFKIYLPQTTEDLVRVVKEVKALGETLHVRSAGHSSNDLVLTEPGGSVLVTAKMNQIVDLDEETMTATVQAGVISAQLDDRLATRGLGLPIIGDHNHITVGGFASTGGISPGSHRHGLFVDTVVGLTYVNWDGEVIECSRENKPEHFFAVLMGLGQHGIIATVTVNVIRVDKYRTLLKNHEKRYYDLRKYLAGAGDAVRNPGDSLYQRGVMLNFPIGGGDGVCIGQFSSYHPTAQSAIARVRDSIDYTFLDGIGWLTDHVPKRIGAALKAVGMAGVIFSPQYATMKNIESFSDKILNSMVGDPTRMFVFIVPVDELDTLARTAWDTMLEFRAKHKCFTVISLYIKNIHSAYLAQNGKSDHFCEVLFYNGIDNEGMTPDVLEALAERLDDITISTGSFRYMHSRTSRDPERRKKVDPNTYYSTALASRDGGASA